MPDDNDVPTDRPRRLTALMKDGRPVLTTLHTNPRADIASAGQSIGKMEKSPERRNLGYAMFMARRHIGRMQDLMEVRYDEVHTPSWVESGDDGGDFTACSCGILVAGRVDKDFTVAEFLDADGHVPFTDPDQDPAVCPRCGHGLPNDRTPGSGAGFWSMTIQRGYVCDACHDHQMYLHYSRRNLGDEQWPVRVPQRFYDESWWPPRTQAPVAEAASEGDDHE